MNQTSQHSIQNISHYIGFVVFWSPDRYRNRKEPFDFVYEESMYYTNMFFIK